MANQFQIQILLQFNVVISGGYIASPLSDREDALNNLQEEQNSRNRDNGHAEAEVQQDKELNSRNGGNEMPIANAEAEATQNEETNLRIPLRDDETEAQDIELMDWEPMADEPMEVDSEEDEAMDE